MIYLTGFGQLELFYCKKIQDLVYYNIKSDWSTGSKKKRFSQWSELNENICILCFNSTGALQLRLKW